MRIRTSSIRGQNCLAAHIYGEILLDSANTLVGFFNSAKSTLCVDLWRGSRRDYFSELVDFA
jgi:hypothetical protein